MYPTSINDVIFTTVGDERLMKRIVNGDIEFPSSTTNSILLHGRFGTGKTTACYLIPALLEYLHASDEDKAQYNWCYEQFGNIVTVTPNNEGKQEVSPANVKYIDCGNLPLNKIDTFIDSVKRWQEANWSRFVVGAQFNHLILDEIDSLTPTSQVKLKGLITSSGKQNIFYLTTNNFFKVDKSLHSRSHCIEMNGVNSRNIHLFIQTMRREFNLEHLTDEQISQVVSPSQGDWREIEKGCLRL